MLELACNKLIIKLPEPPLDGERLRVMGSYMEEMRLWSQGRPCRSGEAPGLSLGALCREGTTVHRSPRSARERCGWVGLPSSSPLLPTCKVRKLRLGERKVVSKVVELLNPGEDPGGSCGFNPPACGRPASRSGHGQGFPTRVLTSLSVSPLPFHLSPFLPLPYTIAPPRPVSLPSFFSFPGNAFPLSHSGAIRTDRHSQEERVLRVSHLQTH